MATSQISNLTERRANEACKSIPGVRFSFHFGGLCGEYVEARNLGPRDVINAAEALRRAGISCTFDTAFGCVTVEC